MRHGAHPAPPEALPPSPARNHIPGRRTKIHLAAAPEPVITLKLRVRVRGMPADALLPRDAGLRPPVLRVVFGVDSGFGRAEVQDMRLEERGRQVAPERAEGGFRSKEHSMWVRDGYE